MKYVLGVLFLIFIVGIMPSPVRWFIGALLLIAVMFAVVGLVTGSQP